MRDDHVRQRLAQANECLAASAAPIQARVAHAVLALVDLSAEEFSMERDRARFLAIIERFSAIESETEGSVWATAQTMSDDQTTAMAREITGLVSSFLLLD
jgi:hypothetical protein